MSVQCSRPALFMVAMLAFLVLPARAEEPGRADAALLNSRVKVEIENANVVRSAPWAGTANFGIAEDLSDHTLYGTDLYSGIIAQYDKSLQLLSTIPGIGPVQSGIAYDHRSDTFWVVDVTNVTLVEIRKTGTPTGNTVPVVWPGAITPGPLTIDPGDSVATFWLEDIGLDLVFEIDMAGLILCSHMNPEGPPAYGNGLSYDAFDPYSDPGNLHITTGSVPEGQVTRMFEGQPCASIPRAYVEICDVSSVDLFVNGIQNTNDPTLSDPEVWYVQANASNSIVEVNLCPCVHPRPSCIPAPNGSFPAARLKGFWTFDGMAADERACSDGTIQGGVSTIPGKVDCAFEFGGNGIVEVPHRPCLEIGSWSAFGAILRGFSLEGWIATTDSGYYQPILTKRDSSSPFKGYVVYLDPRGRLNSNVSVTGGSFGSTVTLAGGIAINDGEWHHFAVTWMSAKTVFGTMLLGGVYVDGLADRTLASATGGGIDAGNLAPLRIGKYGSDVFFRGKLDEISYYSGFLTGVEVASIYAAGGDGKCR